MREILLSISVAVIFVLALLFPNVRERKPLSLLGPMLLLGGCILWYIVYSLIYGAQ